MTSETLSKTFLLVSSIPTPNGRLHLGHIVGPILRLDAATRYLRSRGHKALLACGTDPYESYVTRRAENEGISPRKLAQKFILEIQNDLATFNIDYDIWHDPLLYPGRETYERHCHQLIQRLLSLNAANYKTRRLPYSAIRKQFVPRSCLVGKCPNCQSGIRGSICERCGRQFIAEEVIEPHFLSATAELAADKLAWREIDVLELSLSGDDTRLQNIIADVESLSIPSRHTDIILDHIRDHKCFVELTVPGTWGIPWQGKDDTPQVIFSYFAIYPFYLAVGEIFGAASGTYENAFAVDSNIVTITTYGSDTTVPWIAVPNILSNLDVDANGQRRYTVFDRYWGNEFLCLHGSKFSTSRGHVIWASGFIEQTPVNSDMARYYLATIDPAQQETNFLIEDLVNTINHTVIDEIYHTADACLQEYKPHLVQAASPNMAKVLRKVFDEQDSCFESSQFHLDKAAKVISNWIKTWHQLTDKNQSDSYWFLKSLAIISYPIMPDFSEKLWRHMGATGIPNIMAFCDKTITLTAVFETKVQHINQVDIYPCLPDTLNHLINDKLHPPKNNRDGATEETSNV